MKKNEYEVIVGNLGTVHTGTNRKVADSRFAFYVKDSKTGLGRSGHEEVTLMKNGEPVREYYPRFRPGMTVHVNRDDKQWGRIAANGRVVEIHKRDLLVEIGGTIRANVICLKSECNPVDELDTVDDAEDECRHKGCECASCGDTIEEENDGESTPHGSMHKGCAAEHEAQHPEEW